VACGRMSEGHGEQCTLQLDLKDHTLCFPVVPRVLRWVCGECSPGRAQQQLQKASVQAVSGLGLPATRHPSTFSKDRCGTFQGATGVPLLECS